MRQRTTSCRGQLGGGIELAKKFEGVQPHENFALDNERASDSSVTRNARPGVQRTPTTRGTPLHGSPEEDLPHTVEVWYITQKLKKAGGSCTTVRNVALGEEFIR